MEKQMNSYIIRQGLIYSLVLIILTLFLYFVGADFFAKHFFIIPIFFLIIAIAYPVIVTIRFRKMNGNYLSFSEAFRISFFIMLIAGVISAVFGIILYHVIDPDYPRQIQERMVARMTEYLSGMGLSDDKIQESLNKNNMEEKFSVWGQTKSFLYSIIFYAIFSLIVAAIAKRNRPPFQEQTLDSDLQNKNS
jgi:hypothetical protein